MTIPKFLQIQKRWSPYIILITSFVITGIAAFYVSTTAASQDKFRFDNQVNTVTYTIDNRLNTYIIALLGGSGLFNASNDVTREEFRTYVLGLGLYEKYPGIQGYGLTIKLLPDEVENFNYQITTEGYNNAAVYPQEIRSEYQVVKYLEPSTNRNIKALGYDMYSEKIRMNAIDQATETGRPTMSGKISLVEGDGPKQPGFLIYVPIYKTKNIPPANRKKLLYGFIYSPFRAYDLFDGIFNTRKNLEIAFTIYDSSSSADNLLYVSAPHTNYKPQFTTTRKLTIADRTLIINFTNLPQFEHASEKKLLSTVLVGGITISFLLFLLNFIQLQARESAEQSALVIQTSEHALQESNHRISSILNSITDGFIALDFNWRFTYINKTAARTLGRPPEEILGKNIWEELPGLDSTSFGKIYRKSMEKNISQELEDYYAPFKAWFSVHVYPSKTGLAIYFADMTERHRLEKQKADFIGVASHELKTPVTSMKAYVQVLEKRFMENGDTRSHKLLTKINFQINKLTGLIRDLLDVTTFEAGKLSLNYGFVNLNDLIKQTVEEIQVTTERHTIIIEGETQKLVYTDQERVSQVLTNLISNAVKYSPRTDKINIHVKEKKASVIVCVEDFGVGIADNMQNKVFDRFFRVSDPTRITYPGLGLGLYISSEIIKRLRGKIWLKSKEGKGSTFCFIIPTD